MEAITGHAPGSKALTVYEIPDRVAALSAREARGRGRQTMHGSGAKAKKFERFFRFPLTHQKHGGRSRTRTYDPLIKSQAVRRSFWSQSLGYGLF